MSKPREFWLKDIDVCYTVWESLEKVNDPKIRLGGGEVIHVREVLPDSIQGENPLEKWCDRSDLEIEVESLRMKINTIKHDYNFMINLIERYGSDKDQTLKDCLERMKFRKPLFEEKE